MKDKFENLINEELNKYDFELPKDEYSVIASELAEKLVKLLLQADVVKSVCEHDYMQRGGAVKYYRCVKCGNEKI